MRSDEVLAPVDVVAPAAPPTAAPEALAAARSPRHEVTPRVVRTGLAGAGLLLLVVALLVSNPVLVIVALVLSTAGWLGRRVAVDLVAPVAVLGVLAAAVVAGLSGAAAGVDLLQAPRVLAALYVGLAILALRRARQPESQAWTVARPALSHAWVAYVPALAATAAGLAQLLTWRLPAGWAFLATDLAQHMIILRETEQAGLLDYSSQAYPRGLHMLVGLAALPTDPGSGSADALLLDLQVMAAVSWLSCGVLLAAVATAVLRLTTGSGLTPGMRVLAAAASAALPLAHNDFLGAFLFMGAAPSLLAVLVLLLGVLLPAVLPRHLRGPLHLYPLLAVATMLLAHLWQALVVVPAVMAAMTLLQPEVRAALDVRRAPRQALLRSGLVVGISAWSALLAVGGTLGAGGLDIASIPGSMAPFPVLGLAVGVVGAVALAAVRRSLWCLVLVGAVLGHVVVTLVLLKGAGAGLDLDQYYPRKSLWFLWVLLAPLVVTGVLAGTAALGRAAWRVCARAGDAARLLRFTTASIVVALAVSFVLPQYLSTRPMLATAVTVAPEDSTSARRLALALEHAAGRAPAVAVPVMTGTTPMPDRWSSHVVSKLLRYQTGQPLSFGVLPDVCGDVASVARGGPAYVLTDLDPALMTRMMRVKGCGDVPVVQAPGGSTESDFMAQIVRSALADAERRGQAD